MKDQKVVCERTALAFKEAVEKAIKEGWRVMPNTVATGYEGFVCFMEKEHVGPIQLPKKPS